MDGKYSCVARLQDFAAFPHRTVVSVSHLVSRTAQEYVEYMSTATTAGVE